MRRRLPNIETLVRTLPASTVTTRSPKEVAPHFAGMTQRRVDAIWKAAERLYKTGLHPAIGLCVRRRGHVVIDRAIGHARGNSPEDNRWALLERARPTTLFNLFSASKAITAVLIHLLDERGELAIDDPVADYIPEFARHGKDRTTIRHVLTHRAGIPNMPGKDVDLNLLADPKQIVSRLCDAEPLYKAGGRMAYHALTGGYVLGEIIERVTGSSIRDVLRSEILDPLGIEHMNYGVVEDVLPNVALNAFTGPPVLPPVSGIAKRALGVQFKRGVRWSNDDRFLTAVVPAGNIIGTAEEVSRFYQLLLDGGVWQGHRILKKETILKARQEDARFEIDLSLRLPVRYSIGFVLGGTRYSLYGPNTLQAFGHLGFTNIVAWADPQREIAVCIMTSGKPLITPRISRLFALTRTIAQATRT